MVEGQKPIIYVSNYPLEYFVERIASGRVEIRFPARTAADPAYWEPKPEQITAMQRAGLVFLNGASYEQWLADVTLPQRRLINTARGFEDRLIVLEQGLTHSHGPGGEHEHVGTAFTTWLDFRLAAMQAKVIYEELSSILPQNKDEFENSFQKLERDLLEMDANLEAMTSSSPQTQVVFSHPVYQYFERRYGVKGISLHWEPDTLPDPAMWEELDQIPGDQRPEWMLWEGEPLPETVAELRKRGVESIVFDPCGKRPESGHFLDRMKANAVSLKRIFE